MVTNLDEFTVAVTQNFVSPAGLPATLRLLRREPHLASGVARDASAGTAPANVPPFRHHEIAPETPATHPLCCLKAAGVSSLVSLSLSLSLSLSRSGGL